MINPRALKGLIFAFLLIIVGGFVYIGSYPIGLLIGATIMLFGLLIGLVSCFV